VERERDGYCDGHGAHEIACPGGISDALVLFAAGALLDASAEIGRHCGADRTCRTATELFDTLVVGAAACYFTWRWGVPPCRDREHGGGERTDRESS
jgi:hypothetical protein